MSNTDIKPIETIYKGHKYRSRLEARWAVFFDAAGIEFQYEPEGFVLKDGTYYLPDFYLPKLKGRSGPVYVEVKGVMTQSDMNKIEQFSPLYVVGDIPGGFKDVGGRCSTSGHILHSFSYIDGDEYAAFFYKYLNGEIGLCGGDDYGSDREYPGYFKLDPCYEKARQARFEHGEKG